MRKHFAAFLAILSIFCLLAPASAEDAATVTAGGAADATLRVMLQSLGERGQLNITLTGPYSVSGDKTFQFEADTKLRLGAVNGNIVMQTGGLTIELGTSITLKRHLDNTGKAGGAIIDEAGKNALYMGDLKIDCQGTWLRAIVTVGVEDYLYGVVPYEMSDTFPIEALKAQAVAARTYAMQRKARGSSQAYDVVDTTNDQVYRGLNTRYANAIKAVNDTRGIVGMYKGAFAECFYSASNGGQTALVENTWGQTGDFGYLDMRDDPYDVENVESIVKRFKVPKDLSRLAEPLYGTLLNQAAFMLHSQGEVSQLDAVGLANLLSLETVNPLYAGDNRQYATLRFTLQASVRRVDDEGVMGELEVIEEPLTVDLAVYGQALDLLDIRINNSKYDMVSVAEKANEFVIESRRYGHGVGMSQRGAQWMAGRYGKTALEILSFYYPGMELVQYTWLETPLSPAPTLPMSLAPTPVPTPVPTQGPVPALEEGEQYARVTVDGDASATLNVRVAPSLDDDVIATVRNGWTLIIKEVLETGWVSMRTGDVEGYVSGDFIEITGQTKPEAVSAAPETTAIPAATEEGVL